MSDQDYVYVVTRDGRRVSHTNHESKESAIEESKFWTRAIHMDLGGGRKADPRSVVKIVRTDKPNRIK